MEKPLAIKSKKKQSAELNIENQNQNDLIEKPIFCFHKCKNTLERCSAEPLYTLAQLFDEKLVNKRSLEDELQRHGHPTSRIMPKTKRQRKIEEGKLELINHYRYVHDLI